jgi:Fic family protein
MMSNGTNSSIWRPNYTLTNAVVNGLTRIEAARAIVESTPLPPVILAELSRQARVRATHYSTRIEGNRLTLEEASEVISERRRVFHGRERDVAEVRNYWDALARVEELSSRGRPINEETIQHIAAIVMHGKRARPAPNRTGQNIIRDSISGAIVYLPPEAVDVPKLMKEMVGWINRATAEQTPTAIIAALAQYQFVTIHPYYDGNGRTARLIATYILHSGSYGLRGMLSLEEYHSRDIDAYYGSLDIGGHHNYYEGRAQADLSPWLDYFIGTLALVFEAAKEEALKHVSAAPIAEPDELRRLDQRARRVLALFSQQEEITSSDVAQNLALSERMARILLTDWVADGWLLISNPSRKSRKYSLSASMRSYLKSDG